MATHSSIFAWEISWRRQRQPTPVLLPGKSHGPRSLVGCSPWGHKESDTTEQLHFHFSLSCTGEGNGNPLQCSCLENPRDGGAWWAAVYGVAQSWTWLKWLSSSSHTSTKRIFWSHPVLAYFLLFFSKVSTLMPFLSSSKNSEFSSSTHFIDYSQICKAKLLEYSEGRAFSLPKLTIFRKQFWL